MFAKTRRQFETKLVLKGRLKVSPYGVAMSDSVSDTPVTPDPASVMVHGL